eukprot:s2032_g5.t1
MRLVNEARRPVGSNHKGSGKGAEDSAASSTPPRRTANSEEFTETEGGTFIMQFTFRKATPDKMLGMQVSHYGGKPPLKVHLVHTDGAIDSVNKMCLKEYENRALRQGDEILSVNEVSNVSRMITLMRSENMLSFKILRPRSDREVEETTSD